MLLIFSGHFLLTELLLPKLERSEEGGRIVNVSSRAQLWADSVEPEVVDSPAHFGLIKTYARSKLANVNFLQIIFYILTFLKI